MKKSKLEFYEIDLEEGIEQDVGYAVFQPWENVTEGTREDLLQEIADAMENNKIVVESYIGDDYPKAESQAVMLKLNNLIAECPEGCRIRLPIDA